MLPLPNEIIIHIFKYLDIIDLFNVYKACGESLEICEALKLKTIRIDARKYNFAEEHIKSPIMSKKICQHVKLLNINSIYWISGNRFRQCLGYMLNLESLYALDTALGVTSTDLKVYRKLEKLKNLALTIKGIPSNIVTDFPKVKKLCIHLAAMSLKHLKRVILLCLLELEEFVLGLLCFPPTKQSHLITYLKTYSMHPLELYEEVVGGVPLFLFINKEQIHSDISNRLERKYCSKTVKEFEETYEISHCQISVLAKQEMQQFKKLKLGYCKELNCCCKQYDNDAYENIAKQHDLEELILEGFPLAIDGRFVKNLFQSCTNLKSLSIKLRNHQVSFFNYFLLNANHLNNLRDLRLEMIYIPFNRFLDEFPHIISLKTIYVNCKMQGNISLNYFTKFLNTQAQAVLIAFVIKDVTIKSVIQCRRIMSDFQRNDRRKVYIFERGKQRLDEIVPLLHYDKVLESYDLKKTFVEFC